MSTQFPTAIDSFTTKTGGQTIDEAHINNLQDAVVALQTKVGINSSSVQTTLDYKISSFFAAGRKIWIYENAAPTGWSIVSTTDRVLGVKGGYYGATGGTGIGTWTQPGHTHPTGNFTLTATQIPSHQHLDGVGRSDTQGLVEAVYSPVGVRQFAIATTSNIIYRSYTSSVGSGAAHNHGHTSLSATADTWRPLAAVGIIIQKS
jgi:hypothetical protein